MQWIIVFLLCLFVWTFNVATAVESVNADLRNTADWAESFGLLVNPKNLQALIEGIGHLRNFLHLVSVQAIMYYARLLLML